VSQTQPNTTRLEQDFVKEAKQSRPVIAKLKDQLALANEQLAHEQQR
jgi:hypothetical protein